MEDAHAYLRSKPSTGPMAGMERALELGQDTWVRIPVLFFISCLTLSTSLYFSGLCFLIYNSNSTIYHRRFQVHVHTQYVGPCCSSCFGR